MTYKHEQMFDGIVNSSWREMDDFARRVAEIYDAQPDGTADNPAAWMAYALVSAAEEGLARVAEKDAAERAARAKA